MNDSLEISRFLETKIHNGYMIETGADGLHVEEAEGSLGVVRECLAKSVPLVIDGRVCMAVIPSTKQVNLEKLRRYMGAGEVRPASEPDYKPLLPPGENGFIPIFGRTYGIQVLVAHELMDYQEISFIVGASQVIVHVRLCDYLAAEHPNVCARNAILSDAEGKPIDSVVVYRLDEDTMEKEEVGMLLERRKADRGERLLGLLRLARRSFDGVGQNHAIIIGDRF
ncbi:MAG: aminoacyl-tRNA deacylase [Gemmatimonadota bacterium]